MKSSATALTSDLPFSRQGIVPWKIAGPMLFVALALLGGIFRDDIVAMSSLWTAVPTYNYCLMIPVISGYLIWSQRNLILAQDPSPSFLGLAAACAVLALWWVASAALLAELRQLALVTMIQAVVLATLGWRLYRILAFPLLYLFLMVPTGTVLLAPLQKLTTYMAAILLHFANFPIFAEGTQIEVPHGVYVVAPGCAGLNFILATIALGLLYGRLLYRGPMKRIACLVIGLGLAMSANAVRVFGIVWLAEWTDRKMDIVDDHLLYGWGFFSIIIIVAMVAGLPFADTAPASLANVSPPARLKFPSHHLRLLGILTTVIALALGIETFARASSTPNLNQSVVIELPNSIGGWTRTEPNRGWSPDFPHADNYYRTAFSKDGQRIEVFIGFYLYQADGHKATDTQNQLVPDDLWHETSEQPSSNQAHKNDQLDINLGHYGNDNGQRYLMASWYWIAGHQTANKIKARLMGIIGNLHGDGRAATVALAAEEAPDQAAANAALADFMTNEKVLATILEQAGQKKALR